MGGINNKQNKAGKLREDVQASVASAERARRSPYEGVFRGLILQVVLAMCIATLYGRDYRKMDAIILEPLLGEEDEVDEQMAHFTSTRYWTRLTKISEKEERAAGIKHYVRRPCNPSAAAPRLIIAIRGTRRIEDVVSDIKIALSTLEFSERLERCLDLVKKIIKEFMNWQEAYRDDDWEQSQQSVCCDSCLNIDRCFTSSALEDYHLCQRCLREHNSERAFIKLQRKPRGRWCNVCPTSSVIGNWYKSKSPDHDLCEKCFLRSNSKTISDIIITGHSLIALSIGKKLAAEENQRCQVHCFNPPFVTTMQLFKSKWSYIYKAKQRLWKSNLGPVIEIATQFMKMALAVTLNKGGQLMTELKHFKKLEDWVVVCYIDKHDGICNELKKYYKQKQKVRGGFQIDSKALMSQYAHDKLSQYFSDEVLQYFFNQ